MNHAKLPTLSVIMLMLSLVACQSKTIRIATPCPALTEIRPLAIPSKPVGSYTNGRLAEEYRAMRDSVSIDNELKQRVIEACEQK